MKLKIYPYRNIVLHEKKTEFRPEESLPFILLTFPKWPLFGHFRAVDAVEAGFGKVGFGVSESPLCWGPDEDVSLGICGWLCRTGLCFCGGVSALVVGWRGRQRQLPRS